MLRTSMVQIAKCLVVTSAPFFLAAGADAAVCRAPIQAIGHGQAIEPSLPDFGVAYARNQAIHIWTHIVMATDGRRFANLRRARRVSFSEDRGAGQIYITQIATPCV